MAKILVVEDDSNTARVIQVALETKGHQVLIASSKEEAEAGCHC